MARMKLDMVDIDGVYVCPKCHERNFKKFDMSSYVKDYDIAPASKRHLGQFMFVYECANCKVDLVHYCDM